MATRIKLTEPKIIVPSTREEAEAVVRSITDLKIQERKLNAEMDGRITEVKKKYEERLSEIKSSMTPRMESIHAWADANPSEFGARRSLEMLHGVIGWRMNPPSLNLMKGFTWPAVVNRLRDLGRLEFIQTKEAPNKEALLAARATAPLKSFYLQVVQKDEFYVEPVLSDTVGRETLA
jgi:phage host-nuclease inhibitor protein Gam